MAVYGNAVGGFSTPRTLVLTDVDGNEFVGTVVDDVVMFDATPADVKVGKKFVSDGGCLEGTDTKTYRVKFATYLVLPGKSFSIPLSQYDAYNYTKFQAMVAVFNTTELDSTAVTKILINDALYNIGSNTKISDITKNLETKSVDFNIINDTSDIYIIYYNTYKEE